MHQYTLKPVKIDIKRTQLKTKLSESIQSSFKIQFTFFGLPYGRWVNKFFLYHFPAQEFFCSIIFRTIIYEIRITKLELF